MSIHWKSRWRYARFAWLLALNAFSSGAPAQSAHAETPPVLLRIATFDSGFGGFLTAKSIEQTSRELLRDYNTVITIRHYGDTKNLPYGEKAPEQIAALGSAGVIKALADGADWVFVACNTASTQFDKIQQAVKQAYPGRGGDVVSIINASAVRAKQVLDDKLAHASEANFAVLATPATVKNMAYPRQLAALYKTELQEQPPMLYPQERWYKRAGATVESLTQENTLHLAGGKTVHIYQLAPANWVDLIERGGNLAEKNQAVQRDVNLLMSRLPQDVQLDGVGYFCTHYPVFDNAIRLATSSRTSGSKHPPYIAQGALMAEIFRRRALELLQHHRRARPPSAAEFGRLIARSRASITISGDNVETTRNLARTMFPDDPQPAITQEDFAPAAASQKRAAR